MSTDAEIHDAALARGRSAEFLDPAWQRIAPCQWRAVHHTGVDAEPFVMCVRLGQAVYEWDVTRDDVLFANGTARTPMQGRAFARRAAQDLTVTVPPAPMRRKIEVAEDEATVSADTLAFDRKIGPYLLLALLGMNVAFNYYGLAIGEAAMLDLITALVLLAGGGVLHFFWRTESA